MAFLLAVQIAHRCARAINRARDWWAALTRIAHSADMRGARPK
jgi:hypothetical protein